MIIVYRKIILKLIFLLCLLNYKGVIIYIIYFFVIFKEDFVDNYGMYFIVLFVLILYIIVNDDYMMYKYFDVWVNKMKFVKIV